MGKLKGFIKKTTVPSLICYCIAVDMLPVFVYALFTLQIFGLLRILFSIAVFLFIGNRIQKLNNTEDEKYSTKRTILIIECIVFFFISIAFIFGKSGKDELKSDNKKSSKSQRSITTVIEETTTKEATETSTKKVTESKVVTESVQDIATTSGTSNSITFNKEIHGRGDSDEGRNEPEYVGLYGYAAVWKLDTYKNDIDFTSTPWTVPTYSQIDADHFEESGTLEHKTTIKVEKQLLEHEGWGNYSGYLFVCSVENPNIKYIINVDNFVTNDYWNGDVLNSTLFGDCLAIYNQVSEYLPTDKRNETISISSGATVVIESRTGGENEPRRIECRYNNNGQWSVAYFNVDDLTITY